MDWIHFVVDWIHFMVDFIHFVNVVKQNLCVGEKEIDEVLEYRSVACEVKYLQLTKTKSSLTNSLSTLDMKFFH